MTPTILIIDKDAERYGDYLRSAGISGIEVIEAPEPGSFPPGSANAEVVLGPPDRLAPALPHLPNLRWAQSTWAGVEPLLANGLRRDYLLSGIKGVFGTQMAEYVLCYMLVHERQVLAREQARREHRWDHRVPGRLAGRRVALLGMGDIGLEIAARCRQFGMHCTGVSRRGLTNPGVDRVLPVDRLHQALADADYLVMSLPGTDQTRKLVDAAALAALPAHALVINVGRGASLDETAVDRALRDGSLGGAVLDVFETEPLPPDHPLWEAPNVQITAHTAALSHVEDIAPIFVDNLRRYRDGQVPRYLVDFEAGY